MSQFTFAGTTSNQRPKKTQKFSDTTSHPKQVEDIVKRKNASTCESNFHNQIHSLTLKIIQLMIAANIFNFRSETLI
jgi:hypothetical protein